MKCIAIPQIRSTTALLTVIWAVLVVASDGVDGLPTSQQPLLPQHAVLNRTITPQLFSELEELARIVDIAYCVGVTGIQRVPT